MVDSEILTKSILIPTVVVVVALLLKRLVSLARKGGKAAVLAGALLGMSFIPDPLFEKIYRTVQETRKRDDAEEDESGDPLNPGRIV